jgi:hypothetical protein
MQDDYREMTIAEKRRFWQEHIRSWRESGLRQSDYCRRHGIKSSQWFYWRKRCAEPDTKITFVPLKMGSLPGTTSSAALVRVITPNGFTIEMDSGASSPLFSQLIREVSAI